MQSVSFQGQSGQQMFNYDYVFNMDATQEDVFEKGIRETTFSVLEGFNGTIMAYGQTGAGKTYTMGSNFSTDVDQAYWGVIPRAVRELLDFAQQKTDEIDVQIKISVVELYNERFQDLLSLDSTGRGSRLTRMTKDDFGNMLLQGVKEEELHSLEDLQSVLQQATNNRTTAATLMNAHSSRSHAIFTLQVCVVPKAAEGAEGNSAALGTRGMRKSVLRFVDLAGSERVGKSGVTGENFDEARAINLSLSTLGKVIEALAENHSHKPFRDSKLTHLLQNSLGGNCKTLLLACVSPADDNFSETLSTLRYACTAAKITNSAKICVDPLVAENQKLQREVSTTEYYLWCCFVFADMSVATCLALALLTLDPVSSWPVIYSDIFCSTLPVSNMHPEWMCRRKCRLSCRASRSPRAAWAGTVVPPPATTTGLTAAT